MEFEWDTAKSDKNKIKHGIDFGAAKDLWLDQGRIEIHAPHPIENRGIMIGKLHKKLWTAIYTMRGNTSASFQ